MIPDSVTPDAAAVRLPEQEAGLQMPARLHSPFPADSSVVMVGQLVAADWCERQRGPWRDSFVTAGT